MKTLLTLTIIVLFHTAKCQADDDHFFEMGNTVADLRLSLPVFDPGCVLRLEEDLIGMKYLACYKTDFKEYYFYQKDSVCFLFKLESRTNYGTQQIEEMEAFIGSREAAVKTSDGAIDLGPLLYYFKKSKKVRTDIMIVAKKKK